MVGGGGPLDFGKPLGNPTMSNKDKESIGDREEKNDIEDRIEGLEEDIQDLKKWMMMLEEEIYKLKGGGDGKK